MRTTVLTLLFAISSALPAAAEPDIFYGTWTRDIESTQPERLGLSDFDNRFAIELEGTVHICEKADKGYQPINKVLANNGAADEPITWWVQYECQNETYAYVCIRNSKKEEACANFKNLGWKSAMD